MKKLDPSEFLQGVLTKLDHLPSEFTEQIVDLVNSNQSSRRDGIRHLISKVTNA